MAVTLGNWGNGNMCWWLIRGKICGNPMVAMSNRDSYLCVHGHETSSKDLRERKTI